MLQVAFAVAGQPEAARRTHEEARVQGLLQPFERGAGNRRRQVQFARGGGKAALGGCRHENSQVLKPHHAGLIFKKLLKLTAMLAAFSLV